MQNGPMASSTRLTLSAPSPTGFNSFTIPADSKFHRYLDTHNETKHEWKFFQPYIHSSFININNENEWICNYSIRLRFIVRFRTSNFHRIQVQKSGINVESMLFEVCQINLNFQSTFMLEVSHRRVGKLNSVG